MNEYTRLTVVGELKRAEVAVASTEPLGAALPRLLELLGETGGTVSRPITLVAPDGERIDVAQSPQQLDLSDGSLVHLLRLDTAPPPPVVIDVVDVTAAAHDVRTGRWDAGARTIAGNAGIGLAAAVGGTLCPFDTSVAAAVWLTSAFCLLLAIAAGFGIARRSRVSGSFAAAAMGLAIPLSLTSPITAPHPDAAVLMSAATLLTAISAVTLIGIGVARRRPDATAGGMIGFALGMLLMALLGWGTDLATAAAIVGTIAAFATGPLPWIALAASGLTDVDRRVTSGQPATRVTTSRAISDTYTTLTASVVALTATLAATGVALISAPGLWPALLALDLALVTALRSRIFPLRVQVWSMWTVVAAIGAAGAAVHLSGARGWVGAAAATAAAIAVAAAAIVRPAPHVRAHLRRIGNTLETLAVVALLPLLLGVAGIYADLLGLFGGGS